MEPRKTFSDQLTQGLIDGLEFIRCQFKSNEPLARSVAHTCLSLFGGCRKSMDVPGE